MLIYEPFSRATKIVSGGGMEGMAVRKPVKRSHVAKPKRKPDLKNVKSVPLNAAKKDAKQKDVKYFLIYI